MGIDLITIIEKVECSNIMFWICFSMQKIIERYRKQAKDQQNNMSTENEQYMQVWSSILCDMLLISYTHTHTHIILILLLVKTFVWFGFIFLVSDLANVMRRKIIFYDLSAAPEDWICKHGQEDWAPRSR